MTFNNLEVIEHPALKGREIAIKSGDNLYVWPDFKMPPELKVIEVPTMKETWDQEVKRRMDELLKPKSRVFISIPTSEDTKCHWI
jgi:hypothetical protein